MEVSCVKQSKKTPKAQIVGQSTWAREEKEAFNRPSERNTTILEELVLQRHVRLRLETDASAEDVGKGGALLGESVDDGRTRWGQGSLRTSALGLTCNGSRSHKAHLQHVAQDAEHAMEALVLGRVVLGVGSPGDAGHQLGNDDEIDDQGRRQQRVLADVEDATKDARSVTRSSPGPDQAGDGDTTHEMV